MSNPGVIKLAENIYAHYHVWLDDNIGEAIHLHMNQFRIDMTVKEFEELCDDIVIVINKIIRIENFDLNKYDFRFINNQILHLLHTKRAIDMSIKLSQLRVFDDDNICYLPECNRVKALNGYINIDNTHQRETNMYGQNNSKRLGSALDFIKKNGYPYDEKYIVIIKDKNIIIDGWHRAAALFFLYGDIEIPVKALVVEDEYVDKRYLPIEKIPEKSRIILYGAGVNGRMYFRQLCDKYELVAWCDKLYKEIQMLENIPIVSPTAALDCEFDYVLISALNPDIQGEIMEWLLSEKVDAKKIILP